MKPSPQTLRTALPKPTSVRRVVTGLGPDRKSRVISDAIVAPVTAGALPGYAWHKIWGLDHPASAPNDGVAEPARAHFPPPQGVRFVLFTVPPAGTRPDADLDPRAAQAELDQKLPGRSAHMESDQAGLHTTATIDFIYIVSGEVWLELDDGREVHLQVGDTLVQNGVRHAWRNHSDLPCTMVICLVGAEDRKRP